jgi:hypothetical protein
MPDSLGFGVRGIDEEDYVNSNVISSPYEVHRVF